MSTPGTTNLPRWLKRRIPKGNANHFTARLIDELQLETVCDHARCPNRMECYAHKTATFMILGDVCTRRCGFCHVSKGKTRPVDPSEPRRLADAAVRGAVDELRGLKESVIIGKLIPVGTGLQVGYGPESQLPSGDLGELTLDEAELLAQLTAGSEEEPAVEQEPDAAG